MDDPTQPIGPPLPRPSGPSGPAQAPLASPLLRMVAVASAGLALLVAGLVWDAVLHARDPGLAAEEGVFTLSNPGHLLAGIGIALVAVGLAGALAHLLLAARGARALSRSARLGLAGGGLALALVAGVTRVWAAGAGGHPGHDPAVVARGQDPAFHVHDGAAADTRGPDGAATPGHAHGPNLADLAAATDAERAAAEALWKASATNAERWRDPAAAAAAGFQFRDKADTAAPTRRVRFLHVPNPAWRADGRVLDPAHPETLVYWRGPGDRLVLVGVMYTAARGVPGPTVAGPIVRWHDHESCRDPVTRAKLGRPVDTTCPEGQAYRRSGEMLHVWFTDDLATAFARRPLLAARAS